MAEREVESNNKVATEYTGGASVNLSGLEFHDIYTKNEYSTSRAVYSRINPNGDRMMVSIADGTCTYFLTRDVKDITLRAYDGYVKGTIVVESEEDNTQERPHSTISQEYDSALLKAIQTFGADHDSLGGFYQLESASSET